MLTYGGGLKGNFTRVKKLSSLMRMGVWLGFDELGEKEREKTSKEEKEKLGFLEEARLQGFIAGSLLIFLVWSLNSYSLRSFL